MSWKDYCLPASEFPSKHKMTMIRPNGVEKWHVRRYFLRGFQKSSPPTQEGATIRNLSRARMGMQPSGLDHFIVVPSKICRAR
ncbi:MAG: hypothetical protein PHC30_06855, partial [Lentisphaeria bacterium]|nr:hypothetical protein [Lentisphaeria bacterium]